jgi:exodeoxyribonuclease V beta subunit
LYVALTRAKYRCIVVWGAFMDAGSSALAYLLHAPELDFSQLPVATLKQKFETMGDDQIEQELATLAHQSSNSIEVRGLPEFSKETYHPQATVRENLGFREFAGTIRRDFGIASFTSLVSGNRRMSELPDHDSAAQIRKEAVSSPRGGKRSLPSLSQFPRGTRAGKFLHKVLEGIDFNQSTISSIQTLVGHLLEEYSFELAWEETVTRMVQNILSAPLDLANPDLVLSRISAHERLNEMEFNIPLDLLSSGKLRSILKSYLRTPFPKMTAGILEELGFSPVSGYMKGFIDLIFCFQGCYYLIDWKSNFLGDDLTDYATERLKETMWREGYILQYLLYVVALHRYLGFRLKDYQYPRHFGGVFYVFLRGVDPLHGPKYGVYQDLPDESLVRALSDCLSSA